MCECIFIFFASLQMIEAQGSPYFQTALSPHSAYLGFASILSLFLSIAFTFYTDISLKDLYLIFEY